MRIKKVETFMHTQFNFFIPDRAFTSYPNIKIYNWPNSMHLQTTKQIWHTNWHLLLEWVNRLLKSYIMGSLTGYSSSQKCI